MALDRAVREAGAEAEDFPAIEVRREVPGVCRQVADQRLTAVCEVARRLQEAEGRLGHSGEPRRRMAMAIGGEGHTVMAIMAMTAVVGFVRS